METSSAIPRGLGLGPSQEIKVASEPAVKVNDKSYLELKPSKENNTLSKITIIAGILFTVTLIAVAIAASADPGAFGDLAHQVVVGTSTTATILGVVVLGYIYLYRDSSKKERAREPELKKKLESINKQHRDFVEEKSDLEKKGSIANQSKPLGTSRDDWDTRLKVECPAFETREIKIKGQYHNLAANISNADYITIADTSFGKQFYRIPYFGKYNTKELSASHPLMASRLPKESLKTLPHSVEEAVKDDKNVEIFFILYKDVDVNANDQTKNVRNLFLQPTYLTKNWLDESIKVEMGIFEAQNLETYPSNNNKISTFAEPENGLPVGDFATREVQIHDENCWSPNNTQIVLQDGDITSFYLVSKYKEKTTISHMVIVKESEDNMDSLMLSAGQSTSAGDFLKKINVLSISETLKDQIFKEFNYMS